MPTSTDWLPIFFPHGGGYVLGTSLAERRFVTFTSATLDAEGNATVTAALTTAGAAADGVTTHNLRDADGAGGFVYSTPTQVGPSAPGTLFRVEAGGAFAAGTTVQSDSTGRAVAHTTGVALARALAGASGAGDFVLAVWLSGR